MKCFIGGISAVYKLKNAWSESKFLKCVDPSLCESRFIFAFSLPLLMYNIRYFFLLNDDNTSIKNAFGNH